MDAHRQPAAVPRPQQPQVVPARPQTGANSTQDSAVLSNFGAPSMSVCSTSCGPMDPRGSFKNLFAAGLPRNTSLVFDIELEDGGVGASWQEVDTWDDDEVVSEVQRFVAPSTPAEARLVSDVRAALAHCNDGQDMPRLAQILTALGYCVQLRTALGGGDGADCLRNLRHSFLSVALPSTNGNGSGRRYIVDPQFKEQFIIAKATARYCAIIAAVPSVLVAPEDHLVLLVNFLCTEMSLAFRQLGSVLPPWRQASSVLSKWRPRKSVDEAVAPRAAAAAAATGIAGASVGRPAAQQRSLAMGIASAALGAVAVPQQPQQPQQLQQQQQQAQLQLPHSLSKFMPQAFKPQSVTRQLGVSGGSRVSNFEPLKVYLGGNFIPINPQPSSSAQAGLIGF